MFDPCPELWQRLAGVVGQTKLHKTKILLNSLRLNIYRQKLKEKKKKERNKEMVLLQGGLWKTLSRPALPFCQLELGTQKREVLGGHEKGDPTGSLQDERGRECGYEDQGRGNGRRDRKD